MGLQTTGCARSKRQYLAQPLQVEALTLESVYLVQDRYGPTDGI